MKRILTALLLTGSLHSIAQVCFKPSVNYPVGSTPKEVCTGYFNNDNIVDLAVAIAGTHEVSILLGNGDGTFATASTYTANAQPYAICTADFNGDLVADLAVANNGTFQGLTILLGNGSGAFAVLTSYTLGGNPAGIAVGDFNADGKKDLVVTTRNSSPGYAHIYLGAGNGTFSGPNSLATAQGPSDVLTGDFNKDNKQDVITANINSGTISVMIGQGTGLFNAAQTYTVVSTTSQPWGLASADFNGDTYPDIVTANYPLSNVAVLLNNGFGAFPGANTYISGGSGVYAVWTGDFNGDGRADVATSHGNSHTVGVLTGDGSGGLNPAQTFTVQSTPVSVRAADFNGDGRTDLVTVNNNGTSNTASVLLNNMPGLVGISGNLTICSGNASTLTASGANSYVWNTGASTSSIVVNPTTGTSYTVTGTNTSCTITATGTGSVTVNALPVVTANASTLTAACAGTAATLTGGGAVSYSWSGGVLNGVGFILPNTTTYTVTGTDANNCSNTATITVGVDTIPTPAPICLVTVDSASKFNVIAWEKTPADNIDSIFIYRETNTNVYKLIASLDYDSLSMFVDTVRTLYFPNTGDPNVGTYRYKLQVLDTCGYLSPLGDYHNTIFIINNNGTFSWPQLYTIENNPNPVVSYHLMRDDISNGNWVSIGSVAGTQQVINDPNYSQFLNTASWRVQTQWGISCSPTLVDPSNEAINLNSSKSNVYKVNNPVGMNESPLSILNIAPNPTSGRLIIRLSKSTIDSWQVVNVLGENVQAPVLMYKDRVEMDLSGQPEGIYLIQLISGRHHATARIVVSR